MVRKIDEVSRRGGGDSVEFTTATARDNLPCIAADRVLESAVGGDTFGE